MRSKCEDYQASEQWLPADVEGIGYTGTSRMFHALLSEGECSGASSFSHLPEVLADDDAVLPMTLGFPADLEVLQISSCIRACLQNTTKSNVSAQQGGLPRTRNSVNSSEL